MSKGKRYAKTKIGMSELEGSAGTGTSNKTLKAIGKINRRTASSKAKARIQALS